MIDAFVIMEEKDGHEEPVFVSCGVCMGKTARRIREALGAVE